MAAALVPPALAAAVLWLLPIGDLGVDRVAMAARDYTDMWAAGHLVAHGQGTTLFDPDAFNAALRAMFGAGFPHQVWPYPPPILLLAVPLSMLPLLPGFLLYTAGTAALLWPALRAGGLARGTCAAVLLSPALADNALAGQNGSLTAALLYGGLFLLERGPILAGAILGVLVIKPQFGLLVPLCLIASGHWRALLAMAISASILVVTSGLLFGVHAWVGFFVHTRPQIAAILEAPWQALPAQQNFASVLMAARSLGAGMAAAYGLQTAVTLLCCGVVWRIWRAPEVARIPRAALTGVLGVAASPWVHTYDMIPLSVAVVMLATTARQRSPALLGFAWFWPGAVVLMPIPLALSVASIAGVARLTWQEVSDGDGARRNAPAMTNPGSVPLGSAVRRVWPLQ